MRLPFHLSPNPPPPSLIATESQVFSLKSPDMFHTFFGNPGGLVAAELTQDRFDCDLRLIGRSLVNLLATLGENPYIRYYSPTHHAPLGSLALAPTPGSAHASAGASGAYQAGKNPSEQKETSRWRSALSVGRDSGPTFVGDQLCKKIAEQIQTDLDGYSEVNPDFPPSSNTRPRAVLFVVDRSMDPVAPFLHEFTYQAMVHDLLDKRIQDGDIYRYKVKTALGVIEEKIAKLSEEDPIWTDIRHMHMKEAIDKLQNDFNKFTQEHAGFRQGAATDGPGSTNNSINNMKDMLASLPQYQETRDKFSLHLDMAQECMTIFGEKKLPQAADVEQVRVVPHLPPTPFLLHSPPR